MKLTKIILPLLFAISFAFSEQPAQFGKLLSKKYLEMGSQDQTIVLIYLKDKGNQKNLREISASSVISDRSINRRMKVRKNLNVIDTQDLPIDNSYLQTVANNVVQVRHELKWFNAISALATKQQIDALRNLPFVKEIELVGRWRKRAGDEKEQPIKYSDELPTPSGTTGLDYGTSYTQVNQIKVPQVHNLGIYGQGVVVCVLDNGFRLLTHESFSSMNIIAQHDFVDHKESVIPNNPSTGFGAHGVNTLSTIGGYKPGQLIGPAFKADYILARTENDSSETPIEEDNWAAAIQWADSIGVDVTSTSLGYTTYDAPYTSWTWADMDGNTTLITRASDHAAFLGIVVVNSAGNAGAGDGVHNTLGAPSDGDSVIAAGAVTSAGVRTSFSSVGPTSDGQIKPDIMAMGSSVKVASSTNTTGYGTSNGTSFSCPLSAGVAALILSANPTLTAMEVRDAMRQTASNAATPNNLMGWGILNADSAIKYFGALPIGRISGILYEDMNGNGIRDIDDPAISGRKIFLTGTITDSVTADLEGNYLFDSLAIGNYIVTAEISSGWIQTFPSGSYSINLLHGIDTSGINFGNFKLGSISGIVFTDSNNNRIQDIGENGLANWDVKCLPTGTPVTTNSLGQFTFTDIGPGTFFISESMKTDWYQTVPKSAYGVDNYQIIMTSGLDTSGLIFGNLYSLDTGITVASGWQLLSLPRKLVDHTILNLYPLSNSLVFIFNGSYFPLDTVPQNSAYWIKFESAASILLPGESRTTDTIDVRQGWNIIGALSFPIEVSAIEQIPPDNVLSPYFRYENGYVNSLTLNPYYGYWVKVRENGKLILK
ncbi:MAG: S8 family serine peptidase [Ignavibacteriales bacterium]|nr:S8 family serine peptidase [Ignavibacteriales bacterium]